MNETMWRCDQVRAGRLYNRMMFDTREEAEQFMNRMREMEPDQTISIEPIDARQDRPEDGRRQPHADQRNLGGQPDIVDVGFVRDPEQRSGHTDRQGVKACHQQERECRTLHEPGFLRHA